MIMLLLLLLLLPLHEFAQIDPFFESFLEIGVLLKSL